MVDSKEIIPKIQDVRDSFDKARDTYMRKNPSFQRDNDARITIYSKCVGIFDSALLHYMFRTFQLPKDGWWDSLSGELLNLGVSDRLFLSPSRDDRVQIMNVVDSYWSFSAFILLFSSLESSTRIIIRSVYPGAFNDGRAANLKDIYRRLLGTNSSKYEDLIELLRLGRNTMHNNGVYFPEIKGDNRRIKYKSVTYDFIDGQVVQYGDISRLLFFDIAPDLLSLINHITDSPDVRNHQQIRDPSR